VFEVVPTLQQRSQALCWHSRHAEAHACTLCTMPCCLSCSQVPLLLSLVAALQHVASEPMLWCTDYQWPW
jgi:hypothetical protein